MVFYTDPSLGYRRHASDQANGYNTANDSLLTLQWYHHCHRANRHRWGQSTNSDALHPASQHKAGKHKPIVAVATLAERNQIVHDSRVERRRCKQVWDTRASTHCMQSSPRKVLERDTICIRVTPPPLPAAWSSYSQDKNMNINGTGTRGSMMRKSYLASWRASA